MRAEARILLVGLITLAGAVSASAEDSVIVDERTFSVATRVVEVLPDGSLRPLSFAQIDVTGHAMRPTPHGPESTPIGLWHSRSNASGVATFPEVLFAARARYRVRVPFQGVTFRSEEFTATQPPPQEVRVYSTTTDASAIKLRMHWTIDVGDVFLRVKQLVRVENSSLLAVDFAHRGAGLRVPTLSNVVLDGVAIWGLFPPGKVHGGPTPSTGMGGVLGENGAIVYRGPVLPGSELFFQVAYNVPFDYEDITLGCVSEYEITDAAVSVGWTDRVHPRVRLRGEHRVVRRAQDQVVRLDMLARGAVPAGQLFAIEFERLPVQSKVPSLLAGVGGAGMVGVFTVFLAGLWLRRRREAAAAGEPETTG